jgi:hypothetical protein
MKFNFKYTPIALALITLGVSSLTFAQQDYPDKYMDDVNIEKDIKYKQSVKVKGDVRVNGQIRIDSTSTALVDDSQVNYENSGLNERVTNSATVGKNAMAGASGNIGLNVSAGDNNQQANAAALAVSDASFLFGSVDAEIFADQDVYYNEVINVGQTNISSISGNAFKDATGNIGVNVSSGNSNQQKNDLAVSVGVAAMSTATVSVDQVNEGNTTINSPIQEDVIQDVQVSLGLSATGEYAGIVDQNGDTYPDVWSNDPGDSQVHPTDNGGPSGHVDLDDVAQGASDRPVSSGLNGNGDPNGDTSEGGALGFNEQGDIALSGTVTGLIPVVVSMLDVATTNTSNLGGNAFQGASGKIGVNIASGTNNQQYNGLAISSTHQPSSGGGGGGLE